MNLYASYGPLLLWQWLGIPATIIGSLLVGLITAKFAQRVFERLVRRTPIPWDDKIDVAVHRPAQVWCVLFAISVLVNLLQFSPELQADLDKIFRSGIIASSVWGVIRALYSMAAAVTDETFIRESMDPQQLARIRSIRTQVTVATRILSILLVVIGVAMVALHFSVVRSVGMSLLASAGVAGVVLGFAAQKSLGALFAGIQISFSQPIRIGDTVVVQNEFGIIEDIGLTFVIVKVWDERRLIVPTPRFLDTPFLNLSRTNVGLIGTVFLRVDQAIPVDKLKTEFDRILENEPLWDGRVKALQVTDMMEHFLEVRCLVSARAGSLFDLRVLVREKLLAFIQGLDGGSHLTQTRIRSTLN